MVSYFSESTFDSKLASGVCLPIGLDDAYVLFPRFELVYPGDYVDEF
jgi:hypothetical protein